MNLLADASGAVAGSLVDPVQWIVMGVVALKLRPRWFLPAALGYAVAIGVVLSLIAPIGSTFDNLAWTVVLARTGSAFLAAWVLYGVLLLRRSLKARENMTPVQGGAE